MRKQKAFHSTALAVAILGLLIVLLGTSFLALGLFRRASLLIKRTTEVRTAISRVHVMILDAETGQRGFLLIGDRRYLAPYLAAAETLSGGIDQLRQLTLDNPGQQPRIAELERLVTLRLAAMQRTIDLREANDVVSAVEIVRSDLGRRTTDSIRRVLKDIDSEELDLLETRIAKTEERHLMAFAVSAASSVVLLALGWSLFAINRDIRRREELERSLTQLARQADMATEVALAMIDSAPVPVLLDRCCESAVKHLDAAFARVWTLSSDGTTLELQASAGMYTHTDGAHGRVPLRQFKIGMVASERKPHVTNQVLDDPRLSDREWARREGMVSFAGYPLIVEDRLVGVMAMFSRHPLGQDALDTLFAVANTIANGIERRRVESDRKRGDQERERLILALQRSNRDLDQFAYVASHDLKAPLRGIANLSQWIEEDLGERMTVESRAQMDLLRGRVHRMESLIDGILSYSHAGRARDKIETVDVGKLLSDLVELLAPAQGITVRIAPDMPSSLQSTRVPLQQVFLNLINNAIKHAGRADTRVDVAVDEQGDYYDFSISDNGQGIAREYHNAIWEIFKTLEARDKVEGAGIGLSVVRKIVETRGGKAWVESQPGEGAVFHFLWPKTETENI